MINKSLISAALLGGTFAFINPVFAAGVPVVQSQADHVATSAGAVPLNRQQEVNAADSALIESLLFQLQDLQALVAEQRGIIEELSYQVQVMQQLADGLNLDAPDPPAADFRLQQAHIGMAPGGNELAGTASSAGALCGVFGLAV